MQKALLENICNKGEATPLRQDVVGKIFYKEEPTCNYHGRFCLYILLFPGTLVEFLLSQGHLIRFDMATLGVLKKEKQQKSLQQADRGVCLITNSVIICTVIRS